LAAACRQLKTCQLGGCSMPRVAVNLSVVQFHQKSFLNRIMSIVGEANVSPQCLELELTESILMDNTEASIGVLKQLKASGFTISVDDFGTGYSSLSYLKLLPIDKLKIDQSFVRDCIHDENDAAIIRAIISLSDSLGLKVIAEGIETAEQMDFLAGLGCQDGQGYFIGRPCDSETFCQLLKSTPISRTPH
ncbi:MAG: gmr 4, partial [Proteobacteria bacterium]|nr:gmr 4 [Pseudomonadota bacterium]